MEHHEIEALAREADDAFWEIVAKRFPTAKTGDLSPLASMQLHRSAVAAVEEWIGNNVPAPAHCKTCGSEVVETINDCNFNESECGPCEYRRYASQPELLTLAEAFCQECSDQVQQHQDDIKENFGDPDDLQEQVAYWKQRREQCDAAISQANGKAA